MIPFTIIGKLVSLHNGIRVINEKHHAEYHRMPTISFVYPSMVQPDGTFRGGLLTRWEEASLIGCQYVEIPANFIKNAHEQRATGIGVCQMLTEEAIGLLYTASDNVPGDLHYILHTEPSFSHPDANGIKQPAADLRWHDQKWVSQFSAMLIAISECLGKPADIIEIHPGLNRSATMKDIVSSMESIQGTYNDHFGHPSPTMVLENRNGSIVETGRQLREFWMAMEDYSEDVGRSCGIVLDLSVLFNTARRRGESYPGYLDNVPIDGIKGIHVHTLPKAPSSSDPVPWDLAFAKVKQIKHDFFINPEIHHKNKVGQTIAFCKERLH